MICLAIATLRQTAIMAAAQANGATTATPSPTTTSPTTGASPTPSSPRQAAVTSSEAEAKLVAGSKAAILAAGLSATYFEKHFRLVKVYDAPGDRRVVWQFTVNEYQSTLNDSVGFYMDERGRRVDTHSVKNILPAAHEIERTIPRARAERIMRACIGSFTRGGVVYAAQGNPAHDTLVFTASQRSPTINAARERREKAERKEREERERRPHRASAKKTKVEPRDEIESEIGEGGSPVILGTVDLETGVCTKGYGINGHP